jgi:hypothetical protein
MFRPVHGTAERASPLVETALAGSYDQSCRAPDLRPPQAGATSTGMPFTIAFPEGTSTR